MSNFSQEKKEVTPQSQGGVQIITGKIVDEKGEAVIGASVRVKKSKTGTISDASGRFSISTNSGAILEISYLGYNSQEVVVNGKSSISIRLVEDSKVIDEVVVVGYGSQKKVTLTGAVTSVAGSDLLKSPSPSLGNALTGKLPGVSTVQFSGLPGGDDPLILIRGVASLTRDGSAPLVMVDGVERSFTQIDPNEVADISVLKDASATAVFGVRGANGVILVTTKRGEAGKARISASASFGIQQPTRYIDFANSYEYANTYNNAQRWDGYKESDLKFSPAAVQHFKNHDQPLLYPDMNWVDYILKPMSTQSQQNVNITGGNERAKYFVSVGLLQQGSLFRTFATDPNEKFSYNRYNYRANLDLKIDKISSLAVSIGGRLEAQTSLPRGEKDIFENIMFSNPMAGAGIVDGKRIIGNTDYIGKDMDSGDPLRFYGSGHKLGSTNVLNLDLEYLANLDVLTKGLKFKAKGSYNSNTNFTKKWENYQTYPTYKPYALGDANSGAYPSTTVVLQTSGDKWKPAYSEDKSVGRDWYAEVGLNYARKFGLHDVSALMIYNQSKKYYPNPYEEIPHGYIGFVGRVTYNYASRYMFDFNIGRNGSENFAPGKRFGTFPAASIGWIVTEEPWMKQQKVLSYLKFRYSYGMVGSDYMNNRRFLYLSPEYSVNNGYYKTYGGGQLGYNFGTTNTTFVKGATENTSGNPDVTWETAVKQNLGVDIRTFGDRLGINIDVFNENRKNILINNDAFITAPSALVASPINYGKVHNEGFEVVLNWTDKVGDFKYTLSPNFAFSRNKIVEMAESKQNYDYLYRTGHSVGQPFGYEFFSLYKQGVTEAAYQQKYGEAMPTQIGQANLKNGDCIFADLNKDGKITVEDQHAIGFADNPEITFALNSNFSYKNFDFSMLWNGASNVSRSLSWPYNPQFGQFNKSGLVRWVYENSWTPETAETATLPRITFANVGNNSVGSSVWMQDASYIRLRNLEIGYTFKKIHFISSSANMRIYVNGSNLLTFCKFKGNDPENVGGGYQNAIRYPMLKVYNIGIKLNF